jgi:hypothetical protein
VRGEGRIHLEMRILPRRPGAHHVESGDESERPAVDVIRRAGGLVVDRVALDAALRQRLAHHRIEHLVGHAVRIVRNDRRLREADDGNVA